MSFRLKEKKLRREDEIAYFNYRMKFNLSPTRKKY